MNGGQEDRTELRTMLPFQPSGLKYFTQQRLYICVCVFTYIYKKAYLFVGQLVVVWNFYLKYWAFCVRSSQLERSHHLGPLMWLGSAQKQIDRHTFELLSKHEGSRGDVVL